MNAATKMMEVIFNTPTEQVCYKKFAATDVMNDTINKMQRMFPFGSNDKLIRSMLMGNIPSNWYIIHTELEVSESRFEGDWCYYITLIYRVL